MRIRDTAGYVTLRKLYHSIRRSRTLRRIAYFGTERYCPVCESHVRHFVAPRDDPSMRYDSHCPVCHSKGPHRRNLLYMQSLLATRPAARMLHIAPEPVIAERLARHPGLEYFSGDIRAGVGQLQFDIRDIPFEDESFDFIYCCHVFMVLEDDQPAMRELFRVLRKEGVALLEHPVDWNAPTIETTSEEERVRRFNDKDIVRLYGKDYAERLVAAGFAVSIDPLDVTDEAMERMELYSRDNVICRRPP